MGGAVFLEGQVIPVLDPGHIDSIRPHLWRQIENWTVVLLCFEPAPTAERGLVGVCVHRRSTGKRVVVEFELDPAPLGAGCIVA